MGRWCGEPDGSVMLVSAWLQVGTAWQLHFLVAPWSDAVLAWTAAPHAAASSGSAGPLGFVSWGAWAALRAQHTGHLGRLPQLNPPGVAFKCTAYTQSSAVSYRTQCTAAVMRQHRTVRMCCLQRHLRHMM